LPLGGGGANDSLGCPFGGGFSLFFFLPDPERAPPHFPDIFYVIFAAFGPVINNNACMMLMRAIVGSS